jgi:hypothetical protein
MQIPLSYYEIWAMNSKPYFIPSLPRLLQLAKDFGNGKLAKPTQISVDWKWKPTEFLEFGGSAHAQPNLNPLKSIPILDAFVIHSVVIVCGIEIEADYTAQAH